MLPSISDTSLAVNDSACRSQTAACPLPLPKMFTLSGGYVYTDGPLTQSGLRDASTWDNDYAALLNLDGSGRQMINRMTLHRDSYNNDPVFLDGLTLGVSADYTVEYSEDAGYTMNAGFVSDSPRLQESIVSQSTKLTRSVLPERRSRPRGVGRCERNCQQR
jgi:hypothetical protein